MTRKRIRTVAEVEAIKAQIVAMIEEYPRTAAEISKAVGINGNALGYYFTTLLRAGIVTRHQVSKGRFRYYIRDTAPDTPYKPAPSSKKPAPEKPKHRIPVKQVVVRPFSIAGEEGKTFTVTLPAAPWEAAA